ncbi:molybdate ABC transporter substrate-binding protein [Synechococcus sp. CS-1325]|uniref:molybdate ABC transporter substrate-binding protein n=1 Tax=Synechococcus sp. CS-1325 TaxID=2847979 RepID=UPI000DB808CC|nr:molybdate ABC transporter substrate-binding protein [Synechococcus sp. CS-1325]MCT0199021.1 molybdate ABC transporter substrate-binding protein [Synechococcus sp. CS-1325]PZV00376.1 MAG: molybdate ABC transporter substrate-binding protein [Cyanobium sp.]
MVKCNPWLTVGWLAGAAGISLLLNVQQPADAQKAPAPHPLLVSAAISLTNVLQGLAPAFSRSQRVPAPQFNLGASGLLQRQIEQGAPVDVFLSAGSKQMDALEQAQLLVPGTRRNLISNQLVLVVPANRKGSLGFSDLVSSSIRRIAIGDKAVPAGDYGRQVLRFYKLSNSVQPKLVPLGSVRAVAAAVATGNADAGLVYRSDTFGVSNLRIAATAPGASHRPILYSGAVIRRSQHPALAKAYLDGLQGPAARSAFSRAGFTPLSTSR